MIQDLSDQLPVARNEIQETRDNVNKDLLNKDRLKELFTECDQFKEKLESKIKSIKDERREVWRTITRIYS